MSVPDPAGPGRYAPLTILRAWGTSTGTCGSAGADPGSVAAAAGRTTCSSTCHGTASAAPSPNAGSSLIPDGNSVGWLSAAAETRPDVPAVIPAVTGTAGLSLTSPSPDCTTDSSTSTGFTSANSTVD